MATKKADVKIGSIWSARIGGNLTTVRINRVHTWTYVKNGRVRDRDAGWFATNLQTGREVVIKSAQKLRREIQQ